MNSSNAINYVLIGMQCSPDSQTVATGKCKHPAKLGEIRCEHCKQYDSMLVGEILNQCDVRRRYRDELPHFYEREHHRMNKHILRLVHYAHRASSLGMHTTQGENALEKNDADVICNSVQRPPAGRDRGSYMKALVTAESEQDLQEALLNINEAQKNGDVVMKGTHSYILRLFAQHHAPPPILGKIIQKMILRRDVTFSKIEANYMITFLFTVDQADLPLSIHVAKAYKILDFSDATQFQRHMLDYLYERRDEYQLNEQSAYGISMIFVLEFEWDELPADIQSEVGKL